MKLKNIVHIILFLFCIILIIIFIFKNTDNQKLLKQTFCRVRTEVGQGSSVRDRCGPGHLLKIELIY